MFGLHQVKNMPQIMFGLHQVKITRQIMFGLHQVKIMPPNNVWLTPS